jgi:hypothetical protein
VAGVPAVEDGIVAEGRSDPVGKALKDGVHDEDRRTNGNGDTPLLKGKTLLADDEHVRTVLADDELSTENHEEEHDEHRVCVNALENIELVVDLAGTDHVKDLHHNKSVEDESQMARSTVISEFGVKLGSVPVVGTAGVHVTSGAVVLESNIRFGDEELAGEENEEQQEALVEGHVQNVLDHLAGNNVIVTVLGHAVEETFLGELSGEGKGSKGVHNQVNPEELDGLERGLLGDARADKGGNEGTNVHGELELEEALNVIVNIATPHSSLHNASEVVVSDQNVGSLFAHVSAGHSHGETNVSLLESGGIVGTVTGHSNDISHLAKSGNEQVFVFGAGAGHNLEVRHELLEEFKVSNFFDIVLDDNTSHLLVEFGAFEADTFVANLVLSDDSAVYGNSLRGHNVVTSDHTNGDTSLGDGLDGAGDFRADNVHNTEDADEGESAGLNVFDFTVSGLVVELAVLVGHDVLVGEGDSAEGLLGVPSDDVVEAASHFVGHGLNLSVDVNEVRAAVLNDFGGSLNVEALLVAGVGSLNVVEDSRHPFALGGEGETNGVSRDVLLDNLGLVGAATVEKIDHRPVGGSRVSSNVAGNVLFDKRSENVGGVAEDVLLPVERGHFLGLLVLGDIDLDVLASVDVGDLHLVKSEGSGLVGADVVGTAHDLAGGETLDIVGVLQHALNGVSQGDHDSEGKTLRDSDNNNSYTNNDVVDYLLDELDQEFRGVFVFGGHLVAISVHVGLGLKSGGLFLSAKKVDVAEDKAFNEEANEQHVDGQEGDVCAHLSNVGGNLFELVLERGDLGADLKLFDDFAEAGGISNHDCEHLSFALGDGGAGHEEGGGDVVLARDLSDGGLVHVIFFLVLDAHALGLELLLNFVGLAGHGRLVAKKLGALEEVAINGDVHTVVDLDDVTDVEVVVVENDHLAIAEDIALIT